jgi:hypothetical protein
MVRPTLHIKSRLDSRAQPLLYDAEYRTPIMASYEDLAIYEIGGTVRWL